MEAAPPMQSIPSNQPRQASIESPDLTTEALSSSSPEINSPDDGLLLVLDCCNLIGQIVFALLQGVLGLAPLMLMWSLVCTLVAILLLPFDAVMALYIVFRRAREARFFKTVGDTCVVLVVLVLWPVVVCAFHLMAAFVLAFSEPFERQENGSWAAITTGGLKSMFRFAGDRTRDFLKLCCCNRIDFWHKWKMMVRAVSAFVVFFGHCAVTIVVATIVAVLKLPVYAVIGFLSPCMWFAEICVPIAGYSAAARLAVWTLSAPLWFPLLMLVCGLCCLLFTAAYTIAAVFLLLMSLLGGGLYVADATFKKMNSRITRQAIMYVITEFDKDSSEVMGSILVGDSHVGRLLPTVLDPYPEFTVDDTTATLNYTANALDESCQQFLAACRIQGQELVERGWLEVADFQSAEPFIFIGLPGHVLIDGLQRSTYGVLQLEGGKEISLAESTMDTCWVDPLKGEVADAQMVTFETCLKPDEWRYLKAWVVLSGDEERMASTGVLPPQDSQRIAEVHRLASTVNSMAINITRMSWFQAHFQENVIDGVVGNGFGAGSLKSVPKKCTGASLPSTVLPDASSSSPQETILTMPYDPETALPAECSSSETVIDNNSWSGSAALTASSEGGSTEMWVAPGPRTLVQLTGDSGRREPTSNGNLHALECVHGTCASVVLEIPAEGKAHSDGTVDPELGHSGSRRKEESEQVVLVVGDEKAPEKGGH